ncbi:low specificity L-threonine aldolase [Mucilaginibacter sp. L3T2-6]|uniref:threonine aldolase family protein n=1 Tax=Mucilaginibacter sp. L3T2-6 TaxID=3062491 RepID=UPI002676583C|nr:aminotransferase class I/II-fold pyridoxal phosphate-dependent enzyme [Mucilaginibacter sp. L3T2-6]MDO3645118.1 aminotransferase class I/II-fold pyridoxal phosphate-dependent enzyme [Mucilaginibacter sp. L3T2-6]MDV6217570.1 aminotransferase class I/II-fold pyridoxal phosphate-dependent enzyme [Mucilaginibacter sp. L3T2-6]
MPDKINFASENYAPVHPRIMEALTDVNTGNQPSYGNDEITLEASQLFKRIFGNDLEVFFVFNGTGANNFGLSCMVERHHSVLCSDVAHLYVDEGNAPETMLGCRLYPVKSADGKIIVAELKKAIKRIGDVHHPQPKVVSITQPTEYGTVYTVGELKAIKQLCSEHNMVLHVDGARFFNAAVSLDISLPGLSREVGLDVLTLGGTKTGLMFGEAVVFFNPAVNNPYKFNLKRSMQLASKNRFIAAQFKRLLQDNLWHEIAAHTNSLAKEFEKLVATIPSVTIAYPVETNAVFLNMPRELYDKMQQYANFYFWNDEKSETRLMFSFNNTFEDVREFAGRLKNEI